MSWSYRVVLGRVVLGLVAFSLSFDGLSPVLVPPLSSVSAVAQTTDEEAVRALTLAYGAAIGAGELEQMRGFWNPQAPGLIGHLRVYQGLFASLRIEFVNPKLTRLEITGARAVSHLTADERRLDKQTGVISTERDLFHGVCRVFEWSKTGDGWKMERMTTMQEALAVKLEAATSEAEREALLQKEREFVTDTLPGALTGICYGRLMRGDYAAAQRCYQLQLTVAERIGDQAGLAGAWIGMGMTHNSLGDYEQALSSTQKSLAHYETAGLKRGMALSLARLSRLHRVLGNYRQAFACGRQSLRLYEDAQLPRGIKDALSELADLYSAQNNYSQALAYLERSLALARKLGDKIRLAILRNEVANLQMALGQYEQARAAYQEMLNQTASRGDRGGAASLRMQLGRTYAAQGRTEEALSYFRQALTELEAFNDETLTLSVLEKLSDVYLAQAQLKARTNLVIVPDDKLWELPFQALPTGANRYLIEDAALSYAPSLTVLREMAKRQKPRAAAPTLLAFGNPALDQETMARAALTLPDGKLDPLPEAEAEVKVLGRLYGAPRSKVYTGGAARENRAKAEAAPMRVLHFATHGVLNDAAPLYSHLALTQSDNEDGLLEAWELMRMDLQADLAVLSACETARGRFGAGEGMIGLTWAMFIAGVPTTIVSQWKVESASTRDLMLSFHRQLKRAPPPAKATKAEALQQAALKVMKNQETSHPFYWAGFVLVGDGR